MVVKQQRNPESSKNVSKDLNKTALPPIFGAIMIEAEKAKTAPKIRGKAAKKAGKFQKNILKDLGKTTNFWSHND